jgi:chemotaxis protein CheY-P-specific phosphatase CheC
MLEGIKEDLLAYVATEMFESTAFMFLEPADDEIAEEEVVRAAIDFSYQGERARLVFAATPRFCTELAANFLGVDEDDEAVAPMMEGAVAEMANIVAGFLTAQLFGSAVVELAPPVAGRISREQLEQEAGAAAGRALLESEEGGKLCMMAFPAAAA